MVEAAARSRPLLRGRTGGCGPQTQCPPSLLRTGVPHGNSQGRGASGAVKLRRGHPPRGCREGRGREGSAAAFPGRGSGPGSGRVPPGAPAAEPRPGAGGAAAPRAHSATWRPQREPPLPAPRERNRGEPGEGPRRRGILGGRTGERHP